MATAKLIIDKRAPKKDGTFPVKIYVSHKGDIYIPTGISIKPDLWLDDSEVPTLNKKYNTLLIHALTRIRSALYQLQVDGVLHLFDRASLKQRLLHPEDDSKQVGKSPTLSDAFNRSLVIALKPNTKNTYKYALLKIAEYYDIETLSISDITPIWLQDFERKMQADGLAVNAIGIHMRTLRAVFNRAINDNLIGLECYPFRVFKIKKERTRKRSLTVDQLRLLRDYPCQEHQRKYRDMFMLMFYLLGINAVDLFALKNIINGRIEYRRAKTGRLYSVFVEPEALEIIERYRGQGYLLDICDVYADYSNFLRRMTKNLQEIGPYQRTGQGGKKEYSPLFPDLSSYWSRHTWATIAASLDIPKETIAAALGHGDNDTTSIYIDFDQRKVDAANRRVIDYVNDLIAEE